MLIREANLYSSKQFGDIKFKPEIACSAFSMREGSLIDRVILLRLKGSILGIELVVVEEDDEDLML